MFDLPRKVGEFENEEVIAAIGRFGPFIRHNNKFVTIPKELNPYTIKLDEAIELIEKKRIQEEQRFIKSFEEEPELQILNGRFGAYIAYKKSNYKIPKDTDPQKLTYDECMKIIEEAPDKKLKEKGNTKERISYVIYTKKGATHWKAFLYIIIEKFTFFPELQSKPRPIPF